MVDNVVIKTKGEEDGLIPDKWVLGTGLSTNSLYVTHTDAPLMIVQQDPDSVMPCTVYIRGQIDPKLFNQLFKEAWELIQIYKTRLNNPNTGLNDFLKDVE